MLYEVSTDDVEANQTVIAQGSNAYPLPEGAEVPKEYAEMQDTLAITTDGNDLLVTDQSRIMRFGEGRPLREIAGLPHKKRLALKKSIGEALRAAGIGPYRWASIHVDMA